MDSLRVFIKNLLRGFIGNCCDNIEGVSPCARMSCLDDSSISEHNQSVNFPERLENLTDRPIIAPSDNFQTEGKYATQTNHTHSNINDSQLHKLNNISKTDQICDENDNKLGELNIVIPAIDEMSIVDDLSKVQSPISAKRNSKQFFTSQEKYSFSSKDEITTTIPSEIISPNKQKQIRPIMGKTALLKRANIEASDSLIIHDIVLDKYNPVMNHYVNRMYQRRISRNSISEDENYCNETVFSSPPNYSPISIGSVASMVVYDEKTGFVFPDVSETQTQPAFMSTTKRSLTSLSRRLSMKRAFSFLGSTDDVNVESPFENTRDSSLMSCTGIVDTSFSDYDPEKFLKNALGDVSCFSESGIDSPTSEKDLSNTSRKRTSSVDTTDISSLLSKATSLYSSVRKTFRKHRPRIKSSFCDSRSKSPQDSSNGNSQLESLKKELAIQNEIMFQISKALIYCKTSKEFNCSTQHVEAEKILLVAQTTKEALINEINAIEFDNYPNKNDPRIRGEIEISNIKLMPSENYSNNNNNNNNTSENHDSKIYFLVVATCGKKVVASSVMAQDEKCRLDVRCFEFKDLSADFEIRICVYSMTIRDKDHLIQEHYMKCPSPKTMFHLNKGSKKYRIQTDIPFIKPSAFSLQGTCYIRNPELPKNNQIGPINLNLFDVSVYSTISPTFSAKITSKIRVEIKVTGFLTVGIENGKSCTLWNRRWCILEGTQLKYWNYPSEENTPPLGCVDLQYCMVQQIKIADRWTCARPRTLMLPIQNGDSIKKYLLSADNSAEMELWEREINFVVRSLMTWNCMKCII